MIAQATSTRRPATRPVVECVDVMKTFGGVRALRDVSIDLWPGEITALVGDNGAGKSTLVKILGGIYPPDRGSVVIDEHVFSSLTPRQSASFGIEVVYQDLALCDNLPAGPNIVLGREPARFNLFGLRFFDRRRSVEVGREKLELLGAGVPDWDVPVRRLSGGQRQAIAIARAMISGHRLIILDEPTAALGVRQTEAALSLIRNVVGEKVGVLLIMHNLDQIFAVSDRIVVLRLGAVMFDARTSETSKQEVIDCMTGLQRVNGDQLS